MERRTFLGAVTASATAAVVGTSIVSASQEPTLEMPKETQRGDMRYRQLGNTGEEVSLLGLGGFHIGKQKDEALSTKIIHAAIDAGVNFMDNCWDYHNGGSEIRMGNALQGGYRDKVFLMTKIDGRDRKTAAQQIDESLKRLQTDVIDLMQLHEIIRLEDPDRIFAKGGAMEAVQAAQKAGKIRYIGFTGHKDPMVHLRMLEIAEQHQFRFDAVQMPINVMDAHFRSFVNKVVPILVREKIAILGMKSFGSGSILKSKTVTPVECLHYAMSQPVATVISGIDSMDVLKQNLDAVKTFKPMTGQQTQTLLAKTAQAASEGQFEKFKTTSAFDGTANNPKWLGPPAPKS